MPDRPEYNSWTNSGLSSVLSGVEYESYSNGLFTPSVHDQNVPCARCLTPRSAVMMYPAKRDCPSGWTKEYEGEIRCQFNCSRAGVILEIGLWACNGFEKNSFDVCSHYLLGCINISTG